MICVTTELFPVTLLADSQLSIRLQFTLLVLPPGFQLLCSSSTRQSTLIWAAMCLTGSNHTMVAYGSVRLPPLKQAPAAVPAEEDELDSSIASLPSPPSHTPQPAPVEPAREVPELNSPEPQRSLVSRMSLSKWWTSPAAGRLLLPVPKA